MLPGKSGVEILQTLRARGQRVPVLLLTAHKAVTDRVSGLEADTDDYLTKPFALAASSMLCVTRAMPTRRFIQPSQPLCHSVELPFIQKRSRLPLGGYFS